MIFKLKNFGKIAEADIKLDGITVICGNNNTGKSTVGKALFSFFNSLVDYKDKIVSEKSNYIRNFIIRRSNEFPAALFENDDCITFVSSHNGYYNNDELKKYIEMRSSIKTTEEELTSLVKFLNTSESDILNEYVFRLFDNVMNGQIKKVGSGKAMCSVTGEFKDSKNSISFTAKKCECIQEIPILHKAYYINTPFALDYLNLRTYPFWEINPMERSVVESIIEAQSNMNKDSMTNILDSVANKKDLDEVRKVLHQAYSGDTKIDNGKYYYCEDGTNFDFRNISAGLKSFALIERMLETGVLKKKDVLILDEPEIHLHSEWQIIYAQLIVILQKKFDLTILLVTHSFQFLESLNFFMKKYEISDRGNYYLPELTDRGYIMKSFGNSPDELKQDLVKGSVKLADLEFEYDMEQEDDET